MRTSGPGVAREAGLTASMFWVVRSSPYGAPETGLIRAIDTLRYQLTRETLGYPPD